MLHALLVGVLQRNDGTGMGHVGVESNVLHLCSCRAVNADAPHPEGAQRKEVDKCKTPSSGTFLRRYGVEVMGGDLRLERQPQPGFNVDGIPPATQPIFPPPSIFNAQTLEHTETSQI